MRTIVNYFSTCAALAFSLSVFAVGEAKSLEDIKKIAQWASEESQTGKCSGPVQYQEHSLCRPPYERIAAEASPSLLASTDCTLSRETPMTAPSCPTRTVEQPCTVATGEFAPARTVALPPISCKSGCNEAQICPEHIGSVASLVAPESEIELSHGKSSDRNICDIRQPLGDGCIKGHYEITCVYAVREPIVRNSKCEKQEATLCMKEVTYNQCRAPVCGTDSATHFARGIAVADLATKPGVNSHTVFCTTCEGIPVDGLERLDEKVACLDRVMKSRLYENNQEVHQAVDRMVDALIHLGDHDDLKFSRNAASWLSAQSLRPKQ